MENPQTYPTEADPDAQRAFIIAIGQELTTGQSVDTNSAWLSGELAGMGLATAGHITVPDEPPAIVEAYRIAARQADIVISTGGLGPTGDDLTRQALAGALGVELVLDKDSLAAIEAFFRKLGRTMAKSNRTQAYIPAGCEALANPNGTAPGITGRLGRARVFALPGVPREMKPMFQTCVAPTLPRGKGAIVHRVVRTFGLGESTVGETIAHLMRPSGPIIVGTTVAGAIVSVRITSQGRSRRQAQGQAQEMVENISLLLGDAVIGTDDATMASALGRGLGRAGQTLATAESCTGGLLGKLLTDIGGASKYYMGGVVSYADQAKQNLLDVRAEVLENHGAVSKEVAQAMARGVREKLQADWGIAITGIAGPGGGSPEKPLGLVYTALACPDGETACQKHTFPGQRDAVRLRSALAAMNALRLKLPR
jgi:nicotinamide-nucleotide amidase